MHLTALTKENYFRTSNLGGIKFLRKKLPLLTGPINVNLEYSFSFSGLDPNIYLGFKREILFIFRFQLFHSNCWLLFFWFLQGSAFKHEFWTFSQLIIALWLGNLELRFSNLGFNRQPPCFQLLVFNPNCWLLIFQVYKFQTRKKAIFRFTLIGPLLQ